MKEILLTRGMKAMVDDADYKKLNQYKWYACYHGTMWMAARRTKVGGKQKEILMHRQMFGLPRNDDRMIRHLNHDGLDNQRSNLVIGDWMHKCQNHKIRKTPKSSQYKGVCWIKSRSRWQAFITANNKRTNLGYFVIEEDAANAFNLAALKHFGEFAHLNQIKNQKRIKPC